MNKGGYKKIWAIVLISILTFNTFSPVFTIQAGRDFFKTSAPKQKLDYTNLYQEPTEEIYVPPFDENIEWQTESTPDSIPSEIPASKEKEVELIITSESKTVNNNQVFTLDVTIQNNTEQTIDSIIYTDIIESNLIYIGT